MRRKQESKSKIKFTIPFLLFLCIITTIVVTMFSLSKYQLSRNAEVKGRVAKAIINLNSKNAELVLNIDPMQNENVYTFNVENTEDDKKSEVSMKYILKFLSFNNLPLEFELYSAEDTEETTNLLEGNGNATEERNLNWNEDAHSYKLKIKWKEDEKSYLYAQTIDYVQVVLDSAQLD